MNCQFFLSLSGCHLSDTFFLNDHCKRFCENLFIQIQLRGYDESFLLLANVQARMFLFFGISCHFPESTYPDLIFHSFYFVPMIP